MRASRGVVALLLESDGPGGAETMLLHHAEELRQRGYDVCPIGPAQGYGWLPREFRERGFEPEAISMLPGFDRSAPGQLREIFRRRRVGLAHSHEFTMAVYGALAARAERLPHVITMHGGTYFAERGRRRLALALAAHASRSLVAVSEATAAFLARKLLLPKRRVRVVPNGIPLREGRRETVRRELALPDDTLLLVAIGNLYVVKGHRVLLQALGQLAGEAQLPHWRLAIAGRGEEEQHLRQLAAANGIADRVHLLGFRADAPDILSASDVFVLPSLSEGLPLALLEGMLAGKPIVASRVGGIPEVVRHEEQALLVPPNDPASLAAALRRLLTEPATRAGLAEQARAHATARYTVRTMADAYEGVYQM